MTMQFFEKLLEWLNSKKVKTAIVGKVSVLLAAWFGLSAEEVSTEVAAITGATIGAITTIVTLYLKKQGDVDVTIESSKPQTETLLIDAEGDEVK